MSQNPVFVVVIESRILIVGIVCDGTLLAKFIVVSAPQNYQDAAYVSRSLKGAVMLGEMGKSRIICLRE